MMCYNKTGLKVDSLAGYCHCHVMTTCVHITIVYSKVEQKQVYEQSVTLLYI